MKQNEHMIQAEASMRAKTIRELDGLVGWRKNFDARQKRLIENCINYATHDPAGMPGHNLAIIISEMAELLDRA